MIVHRTTPNSQNWVITANSPPEVKEASTTCHRRSRKTLTLGTKIQLRVTFHNFPNPRDTRYHVTEVTTIHNHLPYICVNSPGSLWRMSRLWVLKHVQVVVVVKKKELSQMLADVNESLTSRRSTKITVSLTATSFQTLCWFVAGVLTFFGQICNSSNVKMLGCFFWSLPRQWPSLLVDST